MNVTLSEQTLRVARVSLHKRLETERKARYRLIDNSEGKSAAADNAISRRRATVGILTAALDEIEGALEAARKVAK